MPRFVQGWARGFARSVPGMTFERLAPPVLRLVVAARALLATDIHAFELRARDGAALPEFTAGSHLMLRTPGGMVRRYSLTNDPAERDRYVIAVKREAAGRGGSANLVDDTAVGTALVASMPRNDFALAARATQHLFIAGGIGITPVMSMLRHLVTQADARFRLHYCTRDAAGTAFRDELAADPFAQHVRIHHDAGDPARALDLWPLLEKPTQAHVYCCGPRPLLDAVRDMTGHWPSSAIHFESFAEAPVLHAADEKPFRVRLARSGTVIEVAADQTLLAALRAAGEEMPSSCEAGTCGTCRTRLLEGIADHRDLVLSESERADFIMPCVSRARSPELVLDR